MDAERNERETEDEHARPEIVEAHIEEMGKAIAPLGDRKRAGALDRRRRSDKDEAHSTMHLLAHSPKNIHCVACRQAHQREIHKR